MDSYLTAEISAEAVRANLKLLRKCLAPGTNLCAVVKGDCYGLGAKMLVGPITDLADCLAVATPEEAIELSKKAMRLSPIYPSWFLYQLGMGYRLTSQYDEAIEALKKCRELNPEDIRSYTELVIAYSQLGQMEEAKAMVSEILKKNPKFSLKRYAKSRFYKDPEQIELELDALRKAGLT